MKWVQDNPLGMALAGMSGVFVLLAIGMAILWSWPVEVDMSGNSAAESDLGKEILTVQPMAAMSNYEVINEKPLFNESRHPEEEIIDESEEPEQVVNKVTDKPDVRLTGIIITPAMKIASLTPTDAKLDSVMAHEGESLTGVFVGWQVSKVHSRAVVLESRDGQSLKLELEIHDVKIKEPPKPAASKKTPEAKTEQDEQLVDEDGKPLSRAEQIRLRIAERREELRLEQEQKAQQDADKKDKPSARQNYRNAIREMTKKKDKESNSEDKKDG